MLGTDDSDDDSGTVFRDVITLALAGFVASVILLLPHINPKAEAARGGAPPPGDMVVELRWPDSIDSDLDLWVAAPDEIPVGYSNKGGRTFNLLRDDRGFYADPAGLNYEVSYSRGLPAGEYVINVHYFQANGGVPLDGVPARLVVGLRRDASESVEPVLTSDVVFHEVGEELTVFRFRIDGHGRLLADTVNHLFKPLREDGTIR
jgi:hypothetical protein